MALFQDPLCYVYVWHFTKIKGLNVYLRAGVFFCMNKNDLYESPLKSYDVKVRNVFQISFNHLPIPKNIISSTASDSFSLNRI